jgi:hypothetical protein
MRLTSRVIAAEKVLGPYWDQALGRRIVTITWLDGHHGNMTYARWLMQEHLGRVLTDDEHVDHVDDDQTNDVLSNLQILTPSANAEKRNGPTEMLSFTCPRCGQPAEKPARFVRHNRKLGKAGPFCGRSCAGKASHKHA